MDKIRRGPTRIFLVVAGLAALGLAACSDDGGGTVDVTLQEWAVVPSEDTASAGEITFALSNDGEDTHEFVVIKTDLDPGSLPTAEDGSVSEEGEGMEVIDEVEDLASGGSEELTVDLDAGNYVLICNIVEETEGEIHYQNGMRTAFTVE